MQSLQLHAVKVSGREAFFEILSHAKLHQLPLFEIVVAIKECLHYQSLTLTSHVDKFKIAWLRITLYIIIPILQYMAYSSYVEGKIIPFRNRFLSTTWNICGFIVMRLSILYLWSHSHTDFRVIIFVVCARLSNAKSWPSAMRQEDMHLPHRCTLTSVAYNNWIFMSVSYLGDHVDPAVTYMAVLRWLGFQLLLPIPMFYSAQQ